MTTETKVVNGNDGTTQTVKVSRLDQIKAEIANSMASEYEAVQKQNLSGLALVQAYAALSGKIDKASKERLDAEVKAMNARTEAQSKDIDAFKAHAQDVFGRAWLTLKPRIEKLDTVKRVTWYVERDADTGVLGTPVLLLGAPKIKGTISTGTRQGGGKSASMTVDGKVYESAAAAKKALLPAKANASMNRASIISALQTAGHRVS